MEKGKGVLGKLSDRQIAGIFFVFSALSLFLLRTIQYSIDSMWYAENISTGLDIYHPHHVVFMPAVRFFYLLFGGEGNNPVLLAQIHNILFGAMGVGIFYRLAAEWTKHRPVAIWGSIAFLFSSGWWRFSTQVEVYIPASACLLLLIYMLTKWNGKSLGLGHYLSLGLVLALSILYHQTNVLFCIPLAFWLWHKHGRNGLKSSVLIIGIAGFLTIAFYVFALWQSDIALSTKGIYNYLLRYAAGDQPGWGELSNMGPEGIYLALTSQLSVIFRSFWVRLAVFMVLFLLILLGIVGGNVWAWFRKMDVGEKARSFRGLLLIWLAVYWLFFLWWLPQESEFFIVTVIPVLLMACDGAARLAKTGRKAWAKWALPALTLLIFVSNAKPMVSAHFEIHEGHQETIALLDLAGDDCLIVAAYSDKQYLRFQFQRETAQIMPLMMHFYKQDRKLKSPDPAQAECFTINQIYLSPKRPAEDDFTAYNHPKEWKSIMVHFFDLKEDQQGIESRRYEMQSWKRFALMKVFPEKIRFPSWKAFWEGLDEAIKAVGQGEHALYAEWYRKHLDLFPKNP